MTDARAIACQLVDIRNVGAYKCVKLTIHVPEEQALHVTQLFGWPTGAQPVPVALARLTAPDADSRPNQDMGMGDARNPGGENVTSTGVDVLESRVPRTALTQPSEDGSPKKSPAQIAGYLCTLASFALFLQEKYPHDWRACRDLFEGWINPGKVSAEVIYLRCNVKSRADLTEDNRGWREIVSDYRAWEKAAEVVPA